ncbi:hypothetical protein SAMN05216417_10541 [Nitrosospira multiformis]|uniref:Uncharacterized protein n=1 Tax=Nitrosospira multiformis TaxID=1231 RepID=A0A1I7GKL4_9PROT|nr:hypothetical protein SAMN05216417_10541 [Nitrosospira multiformis]
MLVCDAQRLTYPARAGTEKPLIAQPSPLTHDIQPGKWFDRANQYASSMSRGTADKIQAPVNAVRAVDVGMAGRAEHHLVTPGRTRKAVRGRIIMVISFCLYDPTANSVYKQGGAYEGARNVNGRS